MMLSMDKQEMIGEVYRKSGNTKELTQNINDLMALPSFSKVRRHQITYVAQRKGWSFPYRFAPWTDEEDDFVLANLGRYSVQQISRIMKKRGWDRTVPAVAKRINALGYSYRKDRYTMSDIQLSLGVNDRRIRKWIKDGKLKAKKSEGCIFRQNPDTPNWEILPFDLTVFVRSYPEELSGLKPDMPWLISLLSEFWSRKW